MKKCVADGAANKYRLENVKLILWIYDDVDLREILLEEWFVEEMEKAEELDNTNSNTKKSRKHTRTYIKSTLDALSFAQNNCPVILPSLTFRHFSNYLTSRKKIDRNNSNTSGSKYLTQSAYNGIRSALQHMYRMSGQSMDHRMAKDLSQFMSGMKRTVADEKAKSGTSLNEGKRPMTFEVYEEMCKILFEGDDDEYLFAHAFLTMEWNLMARSDNCVNMNISHIQWSDDSLLFFFGKTKGNQLGDGNDKPWHVYSNPAKPHLCPVLALAKYVLLHPDLLTNGSPVFPGTYQYKRFIKIFHKVLRYPSFLELGVQPGDLGSHSTRKGSITLVSSGCTVSPPMSSICLRACWSMGPVKDRYIHYEKAGDQFVGRSVTGISSLSKEFAVSPAYFDLTDAPKSVGDEINDKVRMMLNNGGNEESMNSTTFLLVQYLYAAVCYHYDELDKRLSSKNRFRVSPMFIDVTDEVRKCAVVKYPWNSTNTTPLFTGIPPHVIVFAELEKFKMLLEAQKSDLIDSFTGELDKRNVGGDSFLANGILEQITEVQAKMMDVLNRPTGERTGNKGNKNIIYDDFLMVQNSNDDNDSSNEDTNFDEDEENGYVDGNVQKLKPKGLIISWANCCDGNIRLLPTDFTFPSMPLPGLIRMWYCGDIPKNVPPYKMLRPIDVKHLKFGGCKLSNMRNVMKQVKRATLVINRPDLIKSKMSSEDTIVLYHAIKHLFQFDCMTLGKKRRYETISWKTYYNILMKRKGKLVGEI